ncbi:MAG: hypothetical protein WC588_02340 [Candidatus Micrarchaeia archaeon]
MAARKKTEKRKAEAGVLAALWTLALITAAVALLAASSLLIPGVGEQVRGGRFDRAPPHERAISENAVAAIEDNLALRYGFSGLNVILVIYLLYLYVKDYLTIKSGFTFGLVAFLFSFLLYALASFPLMRVVLGPLGMASMLSFVPMLFSALGLLIFAKLSNE